MDKHKMHNRMYFSLLTFNHTHRDTHNWYKYRHLPFGSSSWIPKTRFCSVINSLSGLLEETIELQVYKHCMVEGAILRNRENHEN